MSQIPAESSLVALANNLDKTGDGTDVPASRLIAVNAAIAALQSAVTAAQATLATLGSAATHAATAFDAAGSAEAAQTAAQSYTNTQLAGFAGTTNIVTVGTITAGTWAGATIPVPRGGTGATTITGLVKGHGTSAMTAAVAGTDYLSPTGSGAGLSGIVLPNSPINYPNGNNLTGSDGLYYGNGGLFANDEGYVFYNNGDFLTDSSSNLYYGNFSKLADNSGNLYYGSGTVLADGGGNLYYPGGGLNLLVDTAGNIYSGSGYAIIDGDGQLSYPDGASLTRYASGGNLLYPPPRASAPAYIQGAIYFDTTIKKLRVGGASAWETVTSA